MIEETLVTQLRWHPVGSPVWLPHWPKQRLEVFTAMRVYLVRCYSGSDAADEVGCECYFCV